MRKTIFCGLVAVSLAALAAWAGGEPWKTKPYQQWDHNDVIQVLNKSPWAKTEQVPAPWRANPAQGIGQVPEGGAPIGRGMGTAGQSQGSMGGQGAGNGQMEQGTGGASPNYGGPPVSGTQQPETLFVIRWNSSQTVRKAVVRNAVLAGKMNESNAEKYLAQPATEYEVVVIGEDMTPFAKATDEDLKAKTYIEAKQSKQKVYASKVVVERTQDERQVTAVLFSFPRQAGSNQPLITPKDKGVEFRCALKNLDLRTGFDLRKMVNDKGPAL